jgi:uncharacterized repeat protein (TIGR03806 family)
LRFEFWVLQFFWMLEFPFLAFRMKPMANPVRIAVVCWLTGLCLALPLSHSAGAAENSQRPHGIEKRTFWTASRVIGSPEPPPQYATESAFGKLKFDHPVDLAAAPGSERLFVAEHQSGHVFSFPNKPDVSQSDAELFLDLSGPDRETWSMAFHPGYVTNHFVYVCYNDKKPKPDRNRVSRFYVDPTNSLHAVKDSEYIVLEWVTGGHNGGCIRFGSDGFLYVSTGDGAGIGDELNTGQFLGDLLAGVLRIDVNKSDLGHPYAIPVDNPFITVPGARPEIWAYGLRNPWKMSFDRTTGDLWLGDVGQDLWEMVYLIQRGANYGWPVMEGNHPYNPKIKPGGPSPISPPVVEHGHFEARSLTGGFVYRGARLKELQGAYIYADYETGKIWALRYQDGQVKEHRELLQTPVHISSFGEDNDGELYLVAYEGMIHRIVPAPKIEQPHEFPRKLSETGLFTSTEAHQPAPGLIPYDVNAPLWSDHALKERFIGLPRATQIGFQLEGGWDFPEGAVLMKTFSLEMERGNRKSVRRLETRLLTLQKGLWRGYTYLWNEEQTDADLIPAAGMNRTYRITDARAPGGVGEQTWHFPSRSECILCHTYPTKWVLGLNTLQMNKDHDYGEVTDNQIRTLNHLGVFGETLREALKNAGMMGSATDNDANAVEMAKAITKLPHLVNPQDTTATLDARARSYLHANCSHCHMDYGGGNARFQLLWSLPLEKTGILGAVPQNGNLGINDARIVVPGNPDRSLIPFRMAKLGQGRMPHVASAVVDEQAVKLVREWIAGLNTGN